MLETIKELLENNNFTFHSGNQYSGQPRFVRPIKRVITRYGRSYYGCRVVLETWRDNFFVARIFGYSANDDGIHDITRETLGSVVMMIPRGVFDVDSLVRVERTAVMWANQLS